MSNAILISPDQSKVLSFSEFLNSAPSGSSFPYHSMKLYIFDLKGNAYKISNSLSSDMLYNVVYWCKSPGIDQKTEVTKKRKK